MTHAYDNSYLFGAMQNLGVMMDYAVNGLGIQPNQFFGRFLSSPAATSFASGHPLYLAGMSGIELAHLVLAQSGNAVTSVPYDTLDRSPEYWAGWTLAYLQWYYCLDFGTLARRGVGVTFLLHRYAPLHEADVSKTVQITDTLVFGKQPSMLKAIRKAAGLTQQALAVRSSVSLRMIRAYEQQSQPLSRAEFQTLFRLSHTLGCHPSDLLE